MSSTLYESARAPMRYSGTAPVSKTEQRKAGKSLNECSRELEMRIPKFIADAKRHKAPVLVHVRSSPDFTHSTKVLPDKLRRK